MSRKYVTVQGDMWDGIAHKQLGDVKYMDLLMQANTQYLDTYIFSAGVELVIPEVETAETSSGLPPWKQVNV